MATKPLKEMSRPELLHLFQDLLEWNHQRTDWHCPWCGAEEVGVDAQGEPVDFDIEPDHFRVIYHENYCAVTLIEQAYRGEYKYVNDFEIVANWMRKRHSELIDKEHSEGLAPDETKELDQLNRDLKEID